MISKCEKAEKMFIEALNSLMNDGEVFFIRIEDAYKMQVNQSSNRCVGYYDNTYYYCIPSVLYRAITEYYAKQNIPFPVTKQVLFKQMVDNHIAEGDTTQTTKKKRVGDTNKRYLWLHQFALKVETSVIQNDMVNNPKHYNTGKFECIDVMLETQGKDAVLDFCKCNAFKYIYRANRKNGLEDIKKAKWYLDKYIDLVEGDD